ncbi:hypothetical protein EGW08_011525 [Elysia chlorotica]|uniref:Copper transport protein n=1 Tax=Elysia chlorotica TaxID=188477 RepID=A0A3S1HJF9_ELYCH|nr:hypothetical protein EGW08_011525 [Elysia chlorotica]
MFAACAVSSAYEWLGRVLYRWDNSPHELCTGHRYQDLTLRTLRSTMHALSVCASYLLMLFLMTYNLWVMIAILIGSASGYYFLGPKISPELLSRGGKQGSKNNSNGRNSDRHSSPSKLIVQADRETEIPLTTAYSVSEHSSVPDNKDANSKLIADTTREEGNETSSPDGYCDEQAEEREDLLAKRDDHNIK